jgi:hypothetical protein
VRRVVARTLDEPAEQRRLADCQLADVLAEVRLGGGLHPVGAAAEVDAVEVHLEDVALGQLGLDPDRQDQLADLALDRSLFGETHDVAGQLLSDGRRALFGAAAAKVRVGGANDADRIEPGVLPEPPILGGDKRLLDVLGDPLERDHQTFLQEELSDQLAVGRVDPGRLVGRVAERRQIAWEIVGKFGIDVVEPGGYRERQVHRDQKQEPKRREPLEPPAFPLMFSALTHR